MANLPFDREVHNVRERPLSSDLNLLISQSDLMSRYFNREMSGVAQAGFIGDGFYMQGTGNPREFTLYAGFGWLYDNSYIASNIGSIVNLNDPSAYMPVILNANFTTTVAVNPPAGFERYDLVEVRQNRRLIDSTSRDILDPGTGIFAPNSVYKTLAYDVDGDFGTVLSPASSTAAVSIKQGVPALIGAAVSPTNTPGYVTIGSIYVRDTTTNLFYNIKDERSIFYGFQKMGSTSMSFRINETILAGNNSNAIVNLQSKPLSMKYGVIPGGGGTVPEIQEIFFIHGFPGNVQPVMQASTYSVSGGGPPYVQKFFLGEMTNVVLSSTQAGLLSASPSSLLVATGQRAYKATVQTGNADNLGLGINVGFNINDVYGSTYTFNF